MSKKLSVVSVLSLFGSAGLLIISLFLPWWGMRFFAPQYREGLNIIVYPNKLDGEIDIVNNLNHYIGMANFSEATFPELQYLPYIIVAFAVMIIIVALLRNKKLIYGLLSLFVIGGVIGIVRMNYWLTEFGTNLDPKAPIKIDPFVPPIIGENTLANFVTHSYFTYGAYLLVLAFILMVYPLWRERKR
ncbi:hypothetical protein ACJ2A9_11920 [Anaerobacillus sp. MEB173]|uniref:hypothetical protein n=1 Tax=Anaerobacillus sp. MEB173 TaxID=3383345 RepID=UPI003F92460D